MTVWDSPAGDLFLAGCAKACEAATDETAAFVFSDSGSGRVFVTTIPVGTDPSQVATVASAEYANTTNFAGMATRINWSPTPLGKSSPSWLITTVARAGAPGHFMVKRTVEDTWWRSIAPSDAPWFALATAGGMRAALDGEPLIFKVSKENDDALERGLLNSPSEIPFPSVDIDGLL